MYKFKKKKKEKICINKFLFCFVRLQKVVTYSLYMQPRERETTIANIFVTEIVGTIIPEC